MFEEPTNLYVMHRIDGNFMVPDLSLYCFFNPVQNDTTHWATLDIKYTIIEKHWRHYHCWPEYFNLTSFRKRIHRRVLLSIQITYLLPYPRGSLISVLRLGECNPSTIQGTTFCIRIDKFSSISHKYTHGWFARVLLFACLVCVFV